MWLRRRDAILLAGAAAAAFLSQTVAAQDTSDNELNYRGFSVNIAAAQGSPHIEAVLDSLRHQIDIAADCGALPDILNFFRGRRITLQHIKGDEPGYFHEGFGIAIDAAPQPFQQPILLHELLHAYHALALPMGVENPDVLRFFENARTGHLYPARTENDRYVLKNVREFFAVTGSLYLWGHIDRQPYTRENLRSSQPNYYAWLGTLFGVNK